ncbi:hypothetical protein KI809_19950 [Geobacter pelophilus]|uniref:Uncharacterized protein n=1 Tax=Geoanaerobacter pelophilus TaxID=60036 RepID=A0AAW4L5T3_9BACT|nr:hypothetical protein [Geoanaerobacter pelophilus]MBT0666589.1 hypothetical protein [Geoanaerobacter pelophilus]
MKCVYSDGLKVEYKGSLMIKDNRDVNVYIKEGLIPLHVKGELDVALINFNCSDMRTAVKIVTDTVGKRACIH